MNSQTRSLHVLVAMPAYQGSINVDCAKKISDLRFLLASKGIGFEWLSLSSESLITRGRMACTAYFMSKPEFTHLLFIDADIIFDPEVVLTLLDGNKEICGCPYPRKIYTPEKMFKASMNTIDWNILKQDILEGKSKNDIIQHQLQVVNTSMVFARQSDFVFTPVNNTIEVRNGWMQVKEIGTGFMMIQKSVIEHLMKIHPEMRYTNDVHGYFDLHPNMKDNFYLFFDCRTDGEGDSKRLLSEDYAFSKIARDAGYPIWMFTNTTMYHIGTHAFPGNLFITLYYASEDGKI